MTPRQAVAGLLQIMAVFFLFGAGFFFTCLPLHHELRLKLIDFLTTRPDLCIKVGLFFFFLALIFSFGFYAGARGKYLLLRCGSNIAQVDSTILHKTISLLFENQFSSVLRLSAVDIVGGHYLELRVFMAPLEPKERDKLLRAAETALTKLLFERFGYNQRLTVQVVES